MDLLEYLGSLKVPQGRFIGQPLEVLPWQRQFLKGAFAPDVQEAGLSVARGGGKSTFLAAIATAALDGPLAEPESEVLLVASSKEQGEVLFRHVKRFITPNLPAFKVYDTANNLRVVSKDTGVLLMVRASDPARLHGAAPSLVIADEVAQWPRTRVDAKLAALRTAMGKIPASRLVAIGTRASTPSHPFKRLLADADFIHHDVRGPSGRPHRAETHVAAGQPEPPLLTRPGTGLPQGSEVRQARPVPAGRIQGLAAQPRGFRHR